LPARLINRIDTKIEKYLPEQRLFLKSDRETRFIRLRPLTQAVALSGSAIVIGWTIVATAILLMDSIGSGNFRDQARRDLAVYEERLNAVAQERDSRAEEAVKAQERYAFAMAQISEMQSSLLASEDRRKELETGLDVVQATLRRTMRERDLARAEATEMTLALVAETGSVRTETARGKDVEETLSYLTNALAATAGERDEMARAAHQAQAEVELALLERRLLEERNDEIFSKLEEAVTVSMEPLDRMFRSAGLQPERLLDQVRRGYERSGEALTPVLFSTKGELESPDELRANAILQGLDRMNQYRLAAQKAPFASPTRASVRFTSGFGTRRDPKTGGRRMHSGLDFAGPHGTPILSTAEGVVKLARSHGGYGRTVIIQHDFGIETLYAHMSQIRVTEGQRVSRGDRIGDMGNTGRSTGTHLHYEVRLSGTAVNPMTYIKAARDVF
jgi:murein DD-endopeptidase MepM/ murein hydrolase activator NlpD